MIDISREIKNFKLERAMGIEPKLTAMIFYVLLLYG